MGTRYSISEVRMGDVQVAEEEGNVHGRKTLARRLGDSGTGVPSHRPRPDTLRSALLNSN